MSVWEHAHNTGISYGCYMGKAIQRDEAEQNRAAFLNESESCRKRSFSRRLGRRSAMDERTLQALSKALTHLIFRNGVAEYVEIMIHML